MAFSCFLGFSENCYFQGQWLKHTHTHMHMHARTQERFSLITIRSRAIQEMESFVNDKATKFVVCVCVRASYGKSFIIYIFQQIL